MLAIIDNFDSFTYNLVQYLSELGQQVTVYRNDSITLNALEILNPDYIVISPGPSNPSNAGISLELINYFAGKVPILGVCLVIKQLDKPLGLKSDLQIDLCMVKHPLSIMRAKVSFRIFQTP